jgi:hypothetical protein
MTSPSHASTHFFVTIESTASEPKYFLLSSIYIIRGTGRCLAKKALYPDVFLTFRMQSSSSFSDCNFFRETLIKAFPSAEFALRSSKTAANSCASTGGAKEMLI